MALPPWLGKVPLPPSATVSFATTVHQSDESNKTEKKRGMLITSRGDIVLVGSSGLVKQIIPVNSVSEVAFDRAKCSFMVKGEGGSGVAFRFTEGTQNAAASLEQLVEVVQKAIPGVAVFRDESAERAARKVDAQEAGGPCEATAGDAAAEMKLLADKRTAAEYQYAAELEKKERLAARLHLALSQDESSHGPFALTDLHGYVLASVIAYICFGQRSSQAGIL